MKCKLTPFYLLFITADFYIYGAGNLYSTIKKWHLNIFRHLKKSRYRKNKPVTLFSKTCSIELPASFLIYTLLKKLLAFKIALFLYDRPIFETHKITCTFWLVRNFHYFGQHYDFSILARIIIFWFAWFLKNFLLYPCSYFDCYTIR